MIDLPKFNYLSSGKYYSLQFLLATPSPPSRTLAEIFDLTRLPSRALILPHALLSELQRYKDAVMCDTQGAEIPRHCQKQLTQT